MNLKPNQIHRIIHLFHQSLSYTCSSSFSWSWIGFSSVSFTTTTSEYTNTTIKTEDCLGILSIGQFGGPIVFCKLGFKQQPWIIWLHGWSWLSTVIQQHKAQFVKDGTSTDIFLILGSESEIVAVDWDVPSDNKNGRWIILDMQRTTDVVLRSISSTARIDDAAVWAPEI